MKIKVNETGDLCRHCGTPVEFRESKFNRGKLNKPYFYNAYLKCNSCNAMYMLEEYKVITEDYKKILCQKQPNLL